MYHTSVHANTGEWVYHDRSTMIHYTSYHGVLYHYSPNLRYRI